jgi:hypothetical protein
LIALISALAIGSRAQASPVYEYCLAQGFVCTLQNYSTPVSNSSTTVTPVTNTDNPFPGTATVDEAAAAGFGYVGASSQATLSYPTAPFIGYTAIAGSQADETLDGLYLVGPAGGSVDFSLNLSIDGTIGATGEGIATMSFSASLDDDTSSCTAWASPAASPPILAAELPGPAC